MNECECYIHVAGGVERRESDAVERIWRKGCGRTKRADESPGMRLYILMLACDLSLFTHASASLSHTVTPSPQLSRDDGL